MHGPFLIAASNSINKGKIRITLKSIKDAEHAINDELGQIVVMAGKRLRVHDRPVNILDEIVEEAAPVVGVEIVPDGVDVVFGRVGAAFISRVEIARCRRGNVDGIWRGEGGGGGREGESESE